MPFQAPTVSSLARQTIRAAFEELDQTITPVDSRNFSRTTLEHVRQAALEIEDQLAARQSLRNMRRLAPLLKGLEHYGKVMDVLCNGTPYLAWIWAPITLILRVSSEYVEAFEHIISGYSKIAESLVRFEILGDAFRTHMDFQNTLAVFYADILQFHKHAYKFVKRSGWKLMFSTSWGRFQRRYGNILEDMKRHGELVDKEASAHDIAESRQMRQDIRAWREDSLEQLERLESEQSAKQYKTIVSWLKADESDQLAIFEALSTEGAKFPGTCGWILNNQRLRSWLEKKPDHAVLWLQGNLGTGKSVLSTQIVNFMKSAKMFVLHHFCVHSYASSTMYEQVLRTLLLQLLRQDGELVAHVYEDCVLGKKAPTVQALEKLLRVLLPNAAHDPRQTEYIWIVVDGLDECDAQKQASVINLVKQLTSKSSALGGIVCKILISSGNSSVIANRFRGKQIVSLTEERPHLDKAIKEYASQRLHFMHDKLHQLEIQPQEIKEIELVITRKADGMFLYARLVLDYLAKNIFYSGDEMRMSVHELPDKLFDFYRKILTQILIQLDARSIDRIKCVFGWIAFTKRPLRKMELLSAIAFSTGDPSKISHVAPHFILDVCGALLEERGDTTLSFIHSSVREFLQSSSSQVQVAELQASLEHGRASVACILSGLDAFDVPRPEQTAYVKVLKGLYGILVYATKYWTEYLLSHADDIILSTDRSDILLLATQLAQKLDQAIPGGDSQSDSAVFDARLELLSPHPGIQKQIKLSFQARSLKNLESELLHQADNTSATNPSQQPSGISAMLLSYQKIVRFLLQQDSYPGVSGEELDSFKSQFRTSAYTCRLSSCPHATLGFESKELLKEHENSHARRIACDFPDCKYPLFGSVQALKTHVRKYHNLNPAPKSIRRVGHMRAKITTTFFENPVKAARPASGLEKTVSRVWRDGDLDSLPSAQDHTSGDSEISHLSQNQFPRQSSSFSEAKLWNPVNQSVERQQESPEHMPPDYTQQHGSTSVQGERESLTGAILGRLGLDDLDQARLQQMIIDALHQTGAIDLRNPTRVESITAILQALIYRSQRGLKPERLDSLITEGIGLERLAYESELADTTYKSRLEIILGNLSRKPDSQRAQSSQLISQIEATARVEDMVDPKSSQFPEFASTKTFPQNDAFGYSPLPQQQQAVSSARPTPSSLNWSPQSRDLGLYELIVADIIDSFFFDVFDETYFQLVDARNFAENTPIRVFLDYPTDPESGRYRCQYPWCTTRPTFTQHGFLLDHYVDVHKARWKTRTGSSSQTVDTNH